MRRLTVSLPEELMDALDKILVEYPEFRKKSHVIADALEEFIRIHYPSLMETREERIYPTVLWKLKTYRRKPRGPSLKAAGRKAPGEWKIVELR